MIRKSPYPLFFRERVVKYYLQSKLIKVNDVLNKFQISRGTLFNWIKLNKANKLMPKTRKSKFNEQIIEYIRKYVVKRINFSPNLLMKQIKRLFNKKISQSSIYNILKANNISRKKIKKVIIKKDIRKHKNEQKKLLKKINLIKQNKIVSIDEVSFDTYLSQNYGWSKKGKSIIHVNKKNKTRYTVISAISNNKVILNKIIKGSANKINFLDFLKDLVKLLPNKCFLLLDNARIHHSKIVKSFIENSIHEFIFNIAYSPELNPIELVFSKIKSIVRKKDNSNPKELKINILNSYSKITKENLENFYKHAFNKNV